MADSKIRVAVIGEIAYHTQSTLGMAMTQKRVAGGRQNLSTLLIQHAMVC